MAGFVDNYPHLPGHLTEFKDGGMQLVKDVNPPQTKSVLLLGTGTDGPIMEPVRVDSQTYELFGKSTNSNGVPNGATLPKAFEEAWAGGCRDIRMMRISGAPASLVIQGAATKRTEDKLFEGLLGSAKGNSRDTTFYLQTIAKDVKEVQANGVTIPKDNYTVVLQSVVDDMYTDGGNIYKEDEIKVIKMEKDSQKEVELAKDDIYQKTEDQTYHWSSELSDEEDEHEGYKIVLHAGVDYVYKGELDAKQAYIDNSQKTITEKKVAPDGVEVQPLKRTRITVKDNSIDNGCFIVVKYEDQYGKIPIENASDISGTYISTGTEQEFNLVDEDGEDILPVMGMTKVYFNGVEYTESDTVAEGEDKVFRIEEYDHERKKKHKIVITPGKHAKMNDKIEIRLLYKKEIVYTPEMKIETSFGGNVYNESKIQIDSELRSNGMVEKTIKIIKPRSKRAQINEEPLSYSSFDYPTLGLLARAINSDPKNAGMFKVTLNEKTKNTPTDVLNAIPTPKNFTGGDDGLHLSRQEIFEKLSGKRDVNGGLLEVGAYQLLENYTVDKVVPCEVYADEELVGKNDNFAYELALFCAVASYRNHTTIGMIATTSPEEATLRDIEKHVKHLEKYNNVYLMRDAKGNIIRDNEQKPIDLGKHICVIAGGDAIFNNTRFGAYASNSAPAFAGYVSTLPANSAPTNKVVKYAKGLRVKYSNSQLERLTANRFVTLKYKGNAKDVAVVDAMTASLPTSDYQRLSSMRAVREVSNDIREVADPFLGEPNTVYQRNALSALIDKRLLQHKKAGTIQDYSFNVIASAYDELIGQAQIELTLVPAQELRKITTIISLKPTI